MSIAGDIIAALALLLSVYATLKTSKFNERQKSLIESQEKLNHLLLKKEQSEALMESRADLGANLIRLGNNKCRLKLFNKGKANAYDIRLEFPEGNDLIIQSEIDDKFPLEKLEPYQSVELIAAPSFGTKSKLAAKLIWSDDYNSNNEKIVYVTL